jgi:SAM-dependent methyltransferase
VVDRRCVAGSDVVAVTTVDPLSQAYVGAGARWVSDAELAYAPMARHLVDKSPKPWAGSRVLDAGAGTGAVGELLDERGAAVVAVDLEPSMLTDGRPQRARRVAGDVLVLPFGPKTFDAVVASFVLNHLADPRAGLREFARVTRSGGVVLASVFSVDRSRAKVVIEEQLRSHGWCPPGWYETVQNRANAIGTVEAMYEAAHVAGLVNIDVTIEAVNVRLDDPAGVVQYRLGVPHSAPFVDQLSEPARRALVDAAVAAVARLDEPFRPEVVELTARVS